MAHNGYAYDFPLLKAEIVKAGAEFGPNIFCVDSYVGIQEIFKIDILNSSLSFKSEKENIEEKEIVESELKAVQNLLEAGEFDSEFDKDRSKSIKYSKLQKKEQSRNTSALEILNEKRKSVQAEHIAESETEETEMKAVQSLLEAGEFDTEMEIDRDVYIKSRTLLDKERSMDVNYLEFLSRRAQVSKPSGKNNEQSEYAMKRKELHSDGVFKFKKKLEFPETCSFSLTNLHRQLLHPNHFTCCRG